MSFCRLGCGGCQGGDRRGGRGAEAVGGDGRYGRGQILLKAGQILENKRDAAAETMTREMGKPIRESRGEIGRSIDLLRYYGSWGWRSAAKDFRRRRQEPRFSRCRPPLASSRLSRRGTSRWRFRSGS